MIEPELFTKEQLPVGVVMLITKKEDGSELAAVITSPELAEHALYPVYKRLLEVAAKK